MNHQAPLKSHTSALVNMGPDRSATHVAPSNRVPATSSRALSSPKMSNMGSTGTGTGFDQQYIMSGIIHRFDLDGGYQMTINANSKDSQRGTTEQLS